MRKYIANITPERSSLILQTSVLFGFEDNLRNVVGILLEPVSGYEDFWDRILDLGLIYINGVKYSQLSTSSEPFITTDAYPYIFSVRVNSISEEFPEGVIEAKFFLNGTDVSSRGTIGINITTSDVRKTSSYTREGIKIDSGLSSYMLMRTNPKLTGNIKLVVTSDDKLYLDTFKVSETLNDRVYRKYPVSSDGNYPFDVKTVFSRLPQSELFRLPKDSLNPHKYFTSYDEQYLTEYEYGAETSTDDMYTENMRILAPLHLGKDVPDFFCVFRYEGVLNKESYNSAYPDDAEKLKELIATSETVKIFDLRNYTATGKYIRNYQKMISDFLYGSCYMQFIEQENADDILNIRQGTDSWKGIDVAKGIITNMMESSYFKTQVLNRTNAVQERFNNYVIGGYERNNVLYPYILNLEFMFNDFQDIKEFSMHRYFGLYLTENALAEYDSIIRYNQSGDVLKLDKDDNLVNDDRAVAAVNAPDLTDRIFFITTNNDASRVRNSSEIDAFISKYVLNNPDRHIATVLTEKTKWKDEDKSFITLKFTQQIMYGEHIRIVALNYKRDGSLVNMCLDFIASNDERLVYTENNISAYVETNKPESHTDEDEHNVVPTEIYRVSFYTQSLSDNSIAAPLEEQINRLCAAIRKVVPFGYVSSYNEDSIGIVSSHTDVWLQHILPVNKAEVPQFVYMGIDDTDDGGLVINYGGNASSLNSKYITETLNFALEKKVEPLKVYKPSYKEDVYFDDDSLYSDNFGTDRAVSFVDYSSDDSKTDDTICYFSSEDKTKMVLLSPDTWWYSPGFLAFSLFGFESLGWRYSSITKFIDISSIGEVYTMYEPLDDILRAVKHPLVKTTDNRFYPIGNFTYKSSYLTDNVFLLTADERFHTHTQEIVESEQNVMKIMSPFELNQDMLCFGSPDEPWKPSIHNSQLSLYNPESAQISIMGITTFKDFDMFIGETREEHVTTSDSVMISSGETLIADSPEDDRLRKNVLYTIENDKGFFNGWSLYRFVISGNTMYYTTREDDKTTKQSPFSGALTASTDVILSLETSSNQVFDFIRDIPGQNADNFLVDPDDVKTSMLTIPVVPQTNCMWDSNGIYFDGTPVLDVNCLTKKYEQKGYFTEHGYTLTSDGRSSLYSTDSFVSIDDENKKFRNVISQRTLKQAIHKMLVSNNHIKTAVGYYNPFVQSLEFIYCGIKFNIKFNSDYYNQNIRIGDYNNFDVYIIDEYDPSADNELYISTDEEMILIVNHKFALAGGAKGKAGSILKISDGLSPDSGYGVERSAYSIYSETICGFSDTMCCRKTNTDESVSDSSCFIQEDCADDEFTSNSKVLPHFMYFDTSFAEDSGEIVTVNGNYGAVLRDNDSEACGYFTKKYSDMISLGQQQHNLTSQSYRRRESFVINQKENESESSSKTADEMLDAYMKSMEGDFTCYVISANATEEILITENYKPIIITMERPERIKFNFGYFVPRTYEITHFATNDYVVSQRCDISLLLSGTKIESMDKLNTYTGNRIIPETATTTIDRNYFIQNDWSIMKSNWDAKYYRTYSQDGSYKFLDGYVPGIEDKSFVGSRCMVIHNDFIELDDFSAVRIAARTEYLSSAYNTQAKNIRQCRMIINITQAIYHLFENNQTFCDNWSSIEGDVETSIGNYIKNSISKIYNRQRPRIVQLLTTPDPSAIQMEVDFAPIGENEVWTKTDDFDSEMTVGQNDEMILVITMTERAGVRVHPRVKIYKHQI